MVILVEAVQPDHQGADRIAMTQRPIHFEAHQVQHLGRRQALLGRRRGRGRFLGGGFGPGARHVLFSSRDHTSRRRRAPGGKLLPSSGASGRPGSAKKYYGQ